MLKNILPICLNSHFCRVLIIGGGKVALQKLKALLLCGCRVTVITRKASAQVKQLARNGKITLLLKSFESSDFKKFNLVYACTDNLTLNKKIARLARQKEILCNVASHPELSSFISPAIARNENMYIAVTTS